MHTKTQQHRWVENKSSKNRYGRQVLARKKVGNYTNNRKIKTLRQKSKKGWPHTKQIKGLINQEDLVILNPNTRNSTISTCIKLEQKYREKFASHNQRGLFQSTFLNDICQADHPPHQNKTKNKNQKQNTTQPL